MRQEEECPIKSPFTGGKVKEIFDLEKQTFRGEEYLTHSRYYECQDTGERFTDSAQDDFTLNDLYSQYRIRHGIPFPREIKRIRERYGLNYTQLGKILGIGINQYAKYENGQLPSESNGRLIGAIRRKRVLLDLIENVKPLFESEDFEKIVRQVRNSPDEDTAEDNVFVFYQGTSRSIDNGYGEFNRAKVEEMVRFLSREGTCATKLNKELFYSDFLHFKKYGMSISGLRYQAIEFGPVPVHFRTIYDNVEGLEHLISLISDHEVVKLKSSGYNPDIFSDSEKDILKRVHEKLGAMTTKEVVELSHGEPAWLKHHSLKSIIPYSEAYLLKFPF